MGSILGVFDSNRKSRTLKTAITNLNLAVESMSKEMRYGSIYHCSNNINVTTPVINTPQDCAGGGIVMSFLSSDGEQMTYRLSGTALQLGVDGGGYVAVTAPEIVIDDLDFYAIGTTPGDFLQPKVIIKIQGHAGTGKSRTDFTLQTLVSQRILDY